MNSRASGAPLESREASEDSSPRSRPLWDLKALTPPCHRLRSRFDSAVRQALSRVAGGMGSRSEIADLWERWPDRMAASACTRSETVRASNQKPECVRKQKGSGNLIAH